MTKQVRNIELQYIKGLGPKRAEALAEEGILNIKQLALYFPRSYIDRNSAQSIESLRFAQEDLFNSDKSVFDFKLKTETTILARIYSITEKTIGRRKKMLIINVRDHMNGKASIVFWNRVDWFKSVYKEEQLIAISGNPEIDNYSGNVQFSHPDIEIIDDEDSMLYSDGQILPKYRISEKMQKAGISQKILRKAMKQVIHEILPSIHETMPEYLKNKLEFPDVHTMIKSLHFPENEDLLAISRKRLKFEEIFYFQLFLALRNSGADLKEKGILMPKKSELARKLYDSLPFQLTSDQKKVLREVAEDIKSGKAMNRLLQGDVGSGKTIVALHIMLMVIDHGYQVALMAPTEILAEQHYNTIKKFLEDFDINISLLTGSMRAKQKREVNEEIKEGRSQIVIGTHAIFQDVVEYQKLGMLIIDEQHRFGVEQRAQLRKMGKDSLSEITPHVLVMTATPIPRTLSMTVYGDLDVSLIKELPKNRKEILTKVAFQSQIETVYDFIRDEVKKGYQAYIVYPLVEKSDKLELKSAVEHYEMLSKEVFPDLSCGLLHGQMKWQEKEEVMHDFADKKYDILISTTVIEVGIDVPNSNVMLIENSERFGLSQLHQLRGRVGRGATQSYCILATEDKYKYQMRDKSKNKEDKQANIIRLKTMEETNDGFKIAEVDLKLRGPGDLMGTKQSGLPDFKYINLIEDVEIIESARNEAFLISKNDPNLDANEHKIIKYTYQRNYGENRNFFDIA